MHSANLSRADSFGGCWPDAELAPGLYFWQAAVAASNVGEFVLMPLRLLLDCPPLALTVGSGYLVTPCERMHCANSNPLELLESADEFDPDEPAPDEPDDALGDPPPHAARPSPSATRTASTAAPRQRRRLAVGVRLTA
jgi:hypothetical protein